MQIGSCTTAGAVSRSLVLVRWLRNVSSACAEHIKIAVLKGQLCKVCYIPRLTDSPASESKSAVDPPQPCGGCCNIASGR